MLGCFVVVWMGCGGEIRGKKEEEKAEKDRNVSVY